MKEREGEGGRRYSQEGNRDKRKMGRDKKILILKEGKKESLKIFAYDYDFS